MSRQQGEQGQWKQSGVVAWTDREGPGRPPASRDRLLTFGTAAALDALFIGIMSSDTLCPDHRAWVEALALVGVTCVVLSIVALVRRSAAAPLLTLISATMGIAIGVIDTAHAPLRGQLLAGAFGVVVLAASILSLNYLRMVRWDRAVKAQLTPPPRLMENQLDVAVPVADETVAGESAAHEPVVR